MRYNLEVCIENMVSALEAWKMGAKRIELCSNLMIGGTTPSVELFRQIREKTDMDIRVLMRPRFGDFCYNEYEMAELTEQVKVFREEGADGVVIGVLRPDGSLDTKAMERLISAAGNMKITLHRAFDVCADSESCMEQAIGMGVGTILTSGRKQSALEGADYLRKLSEKAEGRVEILAGGGINPKTMREISKTAGITSFHMSGKKMVESAMKYRNTDVNMGMKGLDEFTLWQTDGGQIADALQVMAELEKEQRL